jgi:peptidoglycan/xylan/chitin deacetylase (PgdA/CDA1 family)
MTSCKIVMYHYVRPIKNSKYPCIKGLELINFKKQIMFFREKFGFQNLDFLFNESFLEGNKAPAILTFDDGLKDHFRHVYPILKSKNIQGLFFPPAKPILENIVLDVHKIHFILAMESDKSKIVKDIFEKIISYQKDYDLENPKNLWDKLAISSRFDTGEVIFIKRILQRELPIKIRTEITNELFVKYVTSNESDFSKELYMSLDEIDEMRENGMYFGSHGYSHQWLSYMSEKNLNIELEKSYEFCERISPNTKKIMCYPYGDYNESVINKIKNIGFTGGLTTKTGNAELNDKNLFTLNRYDTNDFP